MVALLFLYNMIDKKLSDKLEQFCAYTERCRWDVMQKCRKLEISFEHVEDYIVHLEKEGFLSDKRYAQIFIKSKTERSWGPAKIRAALAQKKIDAAVYNEFLRNLDEKETLQKIQQLVTKKGKTIKATDERERKAKLIRFLMSRGYDYTSIKKAIG